MIAFAYDVPRLLRSTIEPARRHRCPDCEEIFECHLCTTEADHQLHISSSNFHPPFICLDCAEEMGLDTWMVISRSDKGAWYEYLIYDYVTGAVTARFHGYVNGWGNGRTRMFYRNFRKKKAG